MPAKNLYAKKNFVELLGYYAEHQADRLAYTFLADGFNVSEQVTFAELHQQVQAIAHYLQTNLVSDSRVILVYPSGIEYVRAYLACLYAGVIAVPSNPPANQRHLPRLLSIINDAKPAAILTDSATQPRLKTMFTDESITTAIISTDALDKTANTLWQPPQISTDKLAMLQYTSGSTGNPNGVMVSHGNLMHNQAMLEASIPSDNKRVHFTWLPLFHDLGMIGNFLYPLYLGAHCVFMSPVTFIQRPFAWLKGISDYKATVSGGPNFAYAMCANKISEEKKQSLDLSSWQIAFNAAEPVMAKTLEDFYQAFKSCGFNRNALCPSYGLAEATLIVTAVDANKYPTIQYLDKKQLENDQASVVESVDKKHYQLVSCGRAILDQKIRIVDPKNLTLCPDGRVGEVWLKGKNIAVGYWNNPSKTKATFNARIKDTNEEPFLRTGDLGFMMSGELYVTGRFKDLIIIRGQNYYPHDIEMLVETSHAFLRPHGGTAFSVAGLNGEQLIIAQEVNVKELNNTDAQAIFAAIAEVIATHHGLAVYDIALIKKGRLPKTTSGKVQRQLTKKLYMDDKLDLVTLTWRQFK